MRRDTRLALKLFVWKAHRLRDGRYVQFLQEQGGTNLSLSFARGQDGASNSLTVDHRHPDDDATDAFVLNFRFFIQDNEKSSFGWLAKHVLDDPDLSNEWKQAFTNIRDQLNTFLDSKSSIIEKVIAPPPPGSSDEARLVGEFHYTNRELMDVFIYGGMAHANVEKWEAYERWSSNPLPFAFPTMRNEFDHIVMTALGAIAIMCGMCEQELAAMAVEAQPQTPAE